MPSRKKTRSSAGFLIVAFLCAGAVFGFAKYVQNGHQFVSKPGPEVTVGSVEPSRPTSTHRRQNGSPDSDGGSKQITGPYALTPVVKGDNVEFTKEAVQIPDDEDPKVYVVNRFLENSKVADPSARLLSIDIHDGVADLYFNGEMDKTYGTDDESTLLNGILTTLGQFPDIKSATFYASGKQISSFGNVDLTEPQPVIRDAASGSTTHSQAQQSSE